MPESPLEDPAYLLRLANARMPFGKYAGRLLIDLPEAYVVWFSRQGWPEGQIGELLASLYAIKENGLEPLLRPLVRGGFTDELYARGGP
jgi:uncharacterized protein (DUF3820 family)